MKKLACIVLSAVLLMGTLALFAGCGQVKDEAKRQEILAAFNKAEPTMFKMSVDVFEETSKEPSAAEESDDKTEETEEETYRESASGHADLTAYEEGGLVYGDMYTDASADSERTSDGTTVTDAARTYALSFARGNIAYTAAGEWETRRGVEEGNFDALLENYRETADPLSSTGISSLSDLGVVGEVDTEEYLDLATHFEGKVFNSFGGYRIEYDFVEIYRKIVQKLENAAPYYAENPDITVAELFEAADLKGAEDIYFLAWGSGHGDELASDCFGSPETFAETMKRVREHTEEELVSKLFAIGLDEDDSCTLTYKVTAELDGSLAFKNLSLTLGYTANTDTDTAKLYFKNGVFLSMEALPEKPVLRALTGLTAGLSRPVPATYDLNLFGSEPVTLQPSAAGEKGIAGTLTASLSVQEDGAGVFSLTFTNGNGASQTETWKVNLLAVHPNESVEHTFFTGYAGGSYLGSTVRVEGGYDTYLLRGDVFFETIPKEWTTVTL